MKFKPLKKIAYLQLVVLHIVIAIIVTVIPVFAKVYSISVLLIFLFLILKSRNKNNEVLVAAAYFTSCEVFLRMTNGGIAYEFEEKSKSMGAAVPESQSTSYELGRNLSIN